MIVRKHQNSHAATLWLRGRVHSQFNITVNAPGPTVNIEPAPGLAEQMPDKMARAHSSICTCRVFHLGWPCHGQMDSGQVTKADHNGNIGRKHSNDESTDVGTSLFSRYQQNTLLWLNIQVNNKIHRI